MTLQKTSRLARVNHTVTLPGGDGRMLDIIWRSEHLGLTYQTLHILHGVNRTMCTTHEL
jgi:hypothetical protein